MEKAQAKWVESREEVDQQTRVEVRTGNTPEPQKRSNKQRKATLPVFYKNKAKAKNKAQKNSRKQNRKTA